ncbi:MAG: hypothetical protein ABIO36_03975, partial [Pyrinomonadaceae bacterium]
MLKSQISSRRIGGRIALFAVIASFPLIFASVGASASGFSFMNPVKDFFGLRSSLRASGADKKTLKADSPVLINPNISVTPLGVPITQNFDTLPASGTATFTNDSTLPGWYSARTGTGTTIVANDGASNAGNLYSYGTGTATDRALGSIGSSNAAAGSFFWGILLTNNTGTTITSLDVSYTGEQWRNSAAAGQTVAFSYITGASFTGNLADFQAAGTNVTALDFTSPVTLGTAAALNGNLAANRTAISFTISSLGLADGQSILLRWSDPDHTGSDHGLSIDDFSVTPQGIGGPTPTPTPTPVGTPTPTPTGTPTPTPTPAMLTPIHDIQGSGTASPLATQTVTTSGIVTGIKGGSSGGYFIQEPDATVDADPNTSEGIFVFSGASIPAGAAIGNNVQVSGTVVEFVFSSDTNSPPITELSSVTATVVLSTGNPLPAPITITPAETTIPSETSNPLDSLEEYEGMRVTVPSLTVTGATQGTINEPNATVASNGVFIGVVTSVARPFREAGVAISNPLPAGAPANVPRFDENPERIRVDSDGQPGTTAIDVAAGTIITNITGPLDYS